MPTVIALTEPETTPIPVVPDLATLLAEPVEPARLPRHRRRIGEPDGVEDNATAVAWAEFEAYNRRAGTVGKHREAE